MKCLTLVLKKLAILQGQFCTEHITLSEFTHHFPVELWKRYQIIWSITCISIASHLHFGE